MFKSFYYFLMSMLVVFTLYNDALALGKQRFQPSGKPVRILVRVVQFDNLGNPTDDAHWFMGNLYEREYGEQTIGTVMVDEYLKHEDRGDYDLLKLSMKGRKAINNGEYNIVFRTINRQPHAYVAPCENNVWVTFGVLDDIPYVSKKQPPPKRHHAISNIYREKPPEPIIDPQTIVPDEPFITTTTRP